MVASLVLVTALCATPSGASSQADLGGWGALRWGMTVQECEAALTRMNEGKAVTLEPIPSERPSQVFEMLNIADQDGPTKLGKRTATFRNGKLERVAFSFDAKPAGDASAQAQAALTKKYGQPIRVRKQFAAQGIVGDLEELEWLVGTTSITLRTTPTLGPVFLEYAERASTDKEPNFKKIGAAR